MCLRPTEHSFQKIELKPNRTRGFSQNRTELEQEIRSVERGYLSHCFKSRSSELGHAPFWGHSSSTVYYFQQWI